MCRSRSRRISGVAWTSFACMLMWLASAGLSRECHTPTDRTAASQLEQRVCLRSGHPDAIPPGMNKPGCVPSPRHPRPVVLVNGVFESSYVSWSYLSTRLTAQGYCVYGTDYGLGTGT